MSIDVKQTREESQAESLRKTGACAMDSLRDMVKALECDFDRLEELKLEREEWVELAIENSQIAIDEREEEDKADLKPISKADATASWGELNPDELEELKELEESAGDCTSREDAETRIQEDPLELLVRSGWESSNDNFTADEFQILLTTGGPAVRIVGELRDGEPYRAWLEVQDWGTPWTEYYETGMADICLTYARQFCFES